MINVRGRLKVLADDPSFVYVGRAMPRIRLAGSPFANPFKLGRDGDRDEVIAMYRTWLTDNVDLLERARRELVGKTLGCWCHPEACHADVLAEIVNG